MPGAHGHRGGRLRRGLVGFPPPRYRPARPQSAALAAASLWRLDVHLPARAAGNLGLHTGAGTAAVLRIRYHILCRAAHVLRRSHQAGSVHVLLPTPSGGIFLCDRTLPAAPLVGHQDRRPGMDAARLADRAGGAMGSAQVIGLARPALPRPPLPSRSEERRVGKESKTRAWA